MQDEKELLRRWKSGDASAGEALVMQCFGAIRRFFGSKVNNGLEDLIQETFMRCLEKRDNFEGRSTFRSFALGIARNVLYEYYRKRNKSGAMDFGVTSIFALDPSPSQHVAVLQQKAHVVEALKRLPIDQQICVELRYWENMSVNELAEVLDVPVGTIKSRLYAGRQGLQKLLGGNAPPLNA